MKDLLLATPPHFVRDFSQKIFFMLYYIEQIQYVYCNYLIIYFPVCDVINFEINSAGFLAKVGGGGDLNILRMKRAFNIK